MSKTRSWLVGLVMAVAMALVMAPSVALGEVPSSPTASDTYFFANGTPITITAAEPENGTLENLGEGFSATGTSAYISWDVNGATKYVGVDSNASVYGGADGRTDAVSVESTSITMTGGTVRNILGGNLGQANANEEGCSAVTGDVNISVTGGKVNYLIYGGGENNACVNGTVTITLNNVALGPSCYVNGGVLGHGTEGVRNIEEGTMTTYAVVNNVVINADSSSACVIGGGGSGSTKVNSAVVTLNKCTVQYLYASGINGEMGTSSLKATGCKITEELAATNRGFIKTADVTLEECDVKLLMTGATTGCFETDSGKPDGSGITGSVSWTIDGQTKVETALLTPLAKRDKDDQTTATLDNITVEKSGDPLNISVAEFKPHSNASVNTFLVSETGTLTLKNVKATVSTGQTLTNVGTIDMDDSSKMTVASGATFEQVGTVNGTVDGDGAINNAYVARIGSTGYGTLQEAVNAVTTPENTTITLLKDTAGDGVVVNGNAKRNLTFDLDGHTYTVTSGVGSPDTETNGFQLIKDNNITFKNGTIAADPANGQEVKILIQNYSNLTLENVTLDGTGLTDYTGLNYTLSNNNGEIILNTGTTIIPRADEEIAMDVCWAKSYTDGARVTVNEGATIQGNVELGLWGKTAYAGQSALTVNGGTITGELKLDRTIDSNQVEETIESLKTNITINGGSFGASVEKFIDATDGAKAQVQSGNTYSYYTTMDAAFGAAQQGDNIIDLTADEGNTVTLTLRYNDGATADSVYKVAENTKVPLRTPTRSGYTFQGWYNERGSKVESPYTVASGATLTAHWSLITAPAPTTHDVTVAAAENGKVSVDKTSASAGEKVTVTATPAEGHEVASVSVTRGEKQVDVTDNGDGTFTFVMPAGDVTVTVAFEASAPAVELPFTDVAEGDWYRGAVSFVYAKGLMTGYEGTTLFGPEDALGREQAAAVLYRALGAGAQAPACGLADVSQADWYAHAVNWAVASGLVTGYDDGSGLFGVGDALTRDQFAAIVARVAKADLSKADPSALDGFSDGGEVAGWAVPAVSWAVQTGVLKGSDDGSGGTELRASAEIARGEMAAMIMRAAEAGLLPTA